MRLNGTRTSGTRKALIFTSTVNGGVERKEKEEVVVAEDDAKIC